MSEIIFNQHGGPPKVPAQNAKPLWRLLVNQAPSDLTREERELLDRVGGHAAQLEAALKQRDGMGGVRDAFLDFVNGWSAVYGALDAVSRIPASASTKGARAAKLVASTFPDALGFTRFAAPQAWAHGDRLLSRIAESGADRQIDELIGPDHLKAAKKVTSALGELIGAGRTPIEIPDPTAVQNLLGKFQRAVGRYSRLMLAKVDEEDPRSVERFRKAVAVPVDRYRSTRTTREDDGEVEPTDPSEPSDPSEPKTPVIDPTGPNGPFLSET
ncbi:hypothetical protein [Sandaracinus amylolyticus]|uniref:Uncharacterized protein n=1 Tax=Sandaracinus amylolyticus TaxID=927083 RepID=A0A0F6YHC1_9BACT|nr:hypothetical protein [Sandaracinus amylolyticus]AKF05491.1 hypothetical protein DB32_002640 [Sandaracinus amylolyticus]